MPKLDCSRVSEGLALLRSTQSESVDAGVAEYQLNPKLDEAAVAAFERTHRISLPNDYRDFVTSIGNGGAGPFYGLFPLGKMDNNFGFRVWQPGDVGILSEPFPFETEWNDLSGKPEDDLAERDEPAYWKQMDAFEEQYWGTTIASGAFPICHQGCALRVLLVVTGQQAGYLWDDRRSEYAGLKPLRLLDGSLATFSAWYEEWLEASLSSMKSIGR